MVLGMLELLRTCLTLVKVPLDCLLTEAKQFEHLIPESSIHLLFNSDNYVFMNVVRNILKGKLTANLKTTETQIHLKHAVQGIAIVLHQADVMMQKGIQGSITRSTYIQPIAVFLCKKTEALAAAELNFAVALEQYFYDQGRADIRVEELESLVNNLTESHGNDERVTVLENAARILQCLNSAWNSAKNNTKDEHAAIYNCKSLTEKEG